MKKLVLLSVVAMVAVSCGGRVQPEKQIAADSDITSDNGQVKADSYISQPDSGIMASDSMIYSDGEVIVPDQGIPAPDQQVTAPDQGLPTPDLPPPPPPAVCGDGKCEPGEQGPTGTCPTDCLPCPEPPPGYTWNAKPVGCSNQYLAWYFGCSGSTYTTQPGGGTAPAGALGVSVDSSCKVRICMTPPGGFTKCVTCGDNGGWLGCN